MTPYRFQRQRKGRKVGWLFAYQRLSDVGTAFVDGTIRPRPDGRRGGYQCVIAAYRLAQNQPADAEMRSTAGWRRWCEKQAQQQGLFDL
jgi:hypothetical protein